MVLPGLTEFMHDNDINFMNNMIMIGRILNIMMIHDIVIMTYLIGGVSGGSKFCKSKETNMLLVS